MQQQLISPVTFSEAAEEKALQSSYGRAKPSMHHELASSWPLVLLQERL